MAIKQTRKCVSVSRQSYAALQQLATARGQSMAAIVEALISNAVAGKPEAVAAMPRGGGPVDAFALNIAAELEREADKEYAVADSFRYDTSGAGRTRVADYHREADDLRRWAARFRAAVQP